MTVAATKDLQTQLRATFIRMAPGRCMTSSLALVAGVYQCAWTRPAASVQRNGVVLTKDAAIPSVNDHWWFDEVNQLFYVKLANAPSDATNVIVLFFYLFATSGAALIANEDPLDSTTPLRQWEPRLSADPSFRQSIRNVIAGVFTIEDSTITLTNTDNFFNQWFTDNDSWNEKSIDAWIGLRPSEADVYDFQRVYRGRAKNANFDRQFLSIIILDAFSPMNQPAFMGDSQSECIVDVVTYPSVYTPSIGKPIPFHVGTYSHYSTYGSVNYQRSPKPDDCAPAFCDNYNQTPSVNYNRTWTLGRCSADGFRSWTLPVPDSSYSTTLVQGHFIYTPGTWATITDANIGDQFSFLGTVLGSSKRVYAIISGIDAANFTIYFCIAEATAVSGVPSSITTYSDPLVIIKDGFGNAWYLSAGRDYTSALTTTSGGNKIARITMISNWEANQILFNFNDSFTGMGAGTPLNANRINPLDPRIHSVFYRFRLTTTNYSNHSDFLKSLVTASGLTIDATTFAAAKSSLAVNAFMSVPYLDESNYRSYVDYAQDLLLSTLGFMVLDSSANVQYTLMAAPTSSDTTDDNFAIRGSDSIAVDYQDVVTGLVAYNPHNSSAESIAASPSPNAIASNLKSQYLHGVVNVVSFRHVLETITGRIAAIMAAQSARRATYTFDVTSKYIDALIGQDAIRKSDLLLGTDAQRTVKIFSLDRHADRISVSAIDLLGVT